VTTPPRTPGTRLKLGPMGELTVDPYWLTITAINPTGDFTFIDEDGMEDTVPAAIWAEEYEPRVLEAVGPPGNADEPPAEEAPEEIPFGNAPPPDNEPEPTPPAEPAPGYMARNAAQNAASAENPGADPHEAVADPMHYLGNLVNRRNNCDAMARKFMNDSGVLSKQIGQVLIDAARGALLSPPAQSAPAPTPDPIGTALGEAMEGRAPQELPPAEPEETPNPQAQVIAEGVAAKIHEEIADTEYETVSRLEMNRALAEVRGISAAQAARMATGDIKTLAQFSQAVEEKPNDWWDGIPYIDKVKADRITDAVEDHFKRFRAKYGRK